MVKPSLALEWILSRAQRFINAILAHADTTVLEPLNQKRIRFVFEPMKSVIEMNCSNNAIMLSSETILPVALTLTATPVQFFKTMTSHSVANLHIAGDGKVAQALQRAIGNLDIDVEAFLETVIGGTIAHKMVQGFSMALEKSTDIKNHTIQDIADYCRYETNTVTSKEEFASFTKEVNELRYATDHLAARITQLKRRTESYHVP
jgi:ubiquinone biosynthesis protein UbiJ